jgi:hypothetical protein
MSCWIIFSLIWNFCLQSVPFLMIFAGGYFYVGFNSLITLYRMHREATEPETEVPDTAVEAPEPIST